MENIGFCKSVKKPGDSRKKRKHRLHERGKRKKEKEISTAANFRIFGDTVDIHH